MINSSARQWADLPKELLEKIGECIGSRVDILRFRSVCSSWRSSVSSPSFDEEIPPLVFNLPHPINLDAVLRRFAICRMEFIPQNPNSPSSSSSSISGQKCWLVKIEESRFGKLKLLHPVSGRRITNSSSMLNLLDFRFVQICRTSMLIYQSVFFPHADLSTYYVPGIIKVVLFPASAGSSEDDEFAILAILREGKLGYWKLGDEEWTVLDDTNVQYDDIIECKGQFYVVHRSGRVSWIDSSLRVIQYSPYLFGCGDKEHLVESCGNLYLIDRYYEREEGTWTGGKNYKLNNSIDFRVHKLDEEWGRWVDVKSIDDRIFVLGVDYSFSTSSQEFNGGKGDCIYFTDDDGVIRVFRLEDHVIQKVDALPRYSKLFWKPST